MESKDIDNIIELIEPVLSYNEKNTHMYGAIPYEYDDMKKVM